MLKQLHLGRELQFWQRPTTATNKEQIRYFCRTIHYEQKNAELDERSGNKIWEIKLGEDSHTLWEGREYLWGALVLSGGSVVLWDLWEGGGGGVEHCSDTSFLFWGNLAAKMASFWANISACVSSSLLLLDFDSVVEFLWVVSGVWLPSLPKCVLVALPFDELRATVCWVVTWPFLPRSGATFSTLEALELTILWRSSLSELDLSDWCFCARLVDSFGLWVLERRYCLPGPWWCFIACNLSFFISDTLEDTLLEVAGLFFIFPPVKSMSTSLNFFAGEVSCVCGFSSDFSSGLFRIWSLYSGALFSDGFAGFCSSVLGTSDPCLIDSFAPSLFSGLCESSSNVCGRGESRLVPPPAFKCSEVESWSFALKGVSLLVGWLSICGGYHYAFQEKQRWGGGGACGSGLVLNLRFLRYYSQTSLAFY